MICGGLLQQQQQMKCYTIGRSVSWHGFCPVGHTRRRVGVCQAKVICTERRRGRWPPVTWRYTNVRKKNITKHSTIDTCIQIIKHMKISFMDNSNISQIFYTILHINTWATTMISGPFSEKETGLKKTLHVKVHKTPTCACNPCFCQLTIGSAAENRQHTPN